MLSTIRDRLAFLALCLSEGCGCKRGCPRCSLRAIDRAANRKPGHLALIVAGGQHDLTCGGAAGYADALGVTPEWLAFGRGPVVEGASFDPSNEGHHAQLACHLLDALGRATDRAPTPAPATPSPHRAGKTMTARSAFRKGDSAARKASGARAAA